ncbi:fibropellin-1-like [Dysidea avara]|uniref:fibropellin-1-like n=1 Tax=Dysidea avara TaxID=196820 RepID=UPI003328F28B
MYPSLIFQVQTLRQAAFARFSGSNCEENIDDCVGVNCNNGTCVDGISSYYCSCNVNYTGSHCEDVDYCAIHSAVGSNGCNSGMCCPNGGTCINVPEEERHECACPPPWLAVHSCRRRAVLCACHNGATCEDDGLHYTCTCPSECHNGGSCRSDFVTGQDCSTDVDECTNSTHCENGATCTNLHGSFHCNCVSGFIGDHCQINIDDCENVTCQNGGSCSDLTNNFQCNCLSGYHGKFCQWCITNYTNPSIPHCICKTGYEGEGCEIDVDLCENSPCLHNGTCHDNGTYYSCQCPPRYSGDNCSIEQCMDDTCGSAGSCYNTATGPRCTCGNGYTGPYCSVDINECLANNNPCITGAECINFHGSFHCVDKVQCPMETDDFGIIWPVTGASTNIIISCPGGINNATRYCNDSGDWQSSNVTTCRSYEYTIISIQTQQVNTAQLLEAARLSADIVNHLATITAPTVGASALPLDLGATVDVINTVIGYARYNGVAIYSVLYDTALQPQVEPLNKKNS